MAHHKSAKKRIRQTARRTQVNGERLSRVRTFVRKVEEAISSGDKSRAAASFREMQPVLMRGGQKGVVHRNKVRRTLSRLSARIGVMST